MIVAIRFQAPIRIRKYIEDADIVVVRFGNKYKQWNAAFDAGYASALGKSIITLHDVDLTHALKEVNASALASCSTPEQVVDILDYVLNAQCVLINSINAFLSNTCDSYLYYQ